MSIETTNLGLIAWDQESDDFNHSQLANNWVKIDEHNHGGIIAESEFDKPLGPTAELLKGKWTNSGRGLPVVEATNPTTGGLQPGSIWRYLIAQRAVGHKQIGLQEVWSENIKNENVETKHLKDEAVTDPKVAAETLTINKFHPSVMPLGSVILWWKPPEHESPEVLDPEGKAVWRIMNGQKWSEIPNALGPGGSQLTEGSIPNALKRFARGSAVGETGATGGSATTNLAHVHTVAPHTHTVSAHVHGLNNHTHGIAEAGAHTHTFAGGFKMRTRQNAFIMGLTFKDAGGATRHNSLESLYVAAPQFDHDKEPGEFEQEVIVDFSGLHTHGGGSTAAGGGGATTATEPGTSATGLTTESALGNVNTEPPWMGFVYIMRVR